MKKISLGTIFFCISLFVASLIYSLPLQNLRGWVFGKIYAATKILIVADSMSLSFFGWPGIILENVNVTLPLGETELELSSASMAVRAAGLAGLFPPVPVVSLHLKELKKGGDLYLKLSHSPALAKLYLDAQDLNLEQLIPQGISDSFFGSGNLESELAIDLTDLSRSLGYIDLRFNKLRTLTQTVGSPDPAMAAFSFVIPALSVGALSGKINIKNGVAEFSNFKFGDTNADLKGSISGDIRLGQNYLKSVVNIVLRLQLSQKILENPQSRTFVSFLQGYESAPGDYAMKWNASIQEFANFSIKVLPEKATP